MQVSYVPIDAQHPRRVAAVYGPVVLVRTQEDTILPEPADPTGWLGPGGKPLEFRAQARSTGTFVPFYKVGFGVPYRMYFDLRA
jgi:hypothetical protein